MIEIAARSSTRVKPDRPRGRRPMRELMPSHRVTSMPRSGVSLLASGRMISENTPTSRS